MCMDSLGEQKCRRKIEAGMGEQRVKWKVCKPHYRGREESLNSLVSQDKDFISFTLGQTTTRIILKQFITYLCSRKNSSTSLHHSCVQFKGIHFHAKYTKKSFPGMKCYFATSVGLCKLIIVCDSAHYFPSRAGTSNNNKKKHLRLSFQTCTFKQQIRSFIICRLENSWYLWEGKNEQNIICNMYKGN